MLRRRQKKPSVPPLTGTVTVPGDKSISHRALICAALADGSSTVESVNVGRDVLATAAALRAFGASCDMDQTNRQVHVEGCGRAGLREPEDVVDAGNSGTTLRILLGIAAGIEGLTVMTGDASLKRRPMLRVVAPLRQMGARIDGRRHGDRAPLSVRGGDLTGIDYTMPVASAQVKSALLFAGLSAEGTTSLIEPAPSRDHTERMLTAAGVRLDRTDTSVSIAGGQELKVLDRVVPGDISAAMFLLVGALLVPESRLVVEDVGVNPTRMGAVDALRQMGAVIELDEVADKDGEPTGRLTAQSSALVASTVGPEGIASLVDEIPILAVAATQAEGTTVFRGVGELRVKESDRIAVLARALSTLGARVAEMPDGLVVTGPTPLSGGEVDSEGDHRIAMALAVAGLIAGGPVRVAGWGSVDTSFPEFLDVLGRAQGRSA